MRIELKNFRNWKYFRSKKTQLQAQVQAHPIVVQNVNESVDKHLSAEADFILQNYQNMDHQIQAQVHGKLDSMMKAIDINQ